MLSRWVRTWHTRLLTPFLRALIRFGVTPNALTLSSCLIITLAGIILASGNFLVAAAVLVCGAVLDGIDGEVARLMHAETRLGAFFDSIADHLSDFALYLGLAWFYVNQNARTEIILLVCALFGSLIGSLIRSRAGMLGIQTKDVGFATRLERMIVLMLGLLLDQMLIALSILAIMNNISALERFVHSVRALRMSEGAK